MTGGTVGTGSPRLLFPTGDSNDGFATRNSDKGNPENVIRELLQNCLDARVGDRPVEVVITIREVPVSDLPALDDYRKAFYMARQQREKANALSVMEEQIVGRIDGVLSSEKMRVLFCRDNGHGLNPDRMRRLLSESNSSKGRDAGGAGSVGLGHMTAFSASDLRYVCYAGRHISQDASLPDELATIVSGRATLAAHMCSEQEASEREDKSKLRSPKGTLAYDELKRLELFSPGFELLTEPPSLLDSEVRQMDFTGAVVAICGFDNFAEETGAENVDSISKVTVSHFLSAVVDRRMSVTVSDEITGEIQTINADNIEEKLNPDGRERARTGVDSFPDKLVYRAYHTIRNGETLEDVGGAKVLFRRLEAGQRPQVNVFRDGMWITKSAPGLKRPDFNGYQPFDAVLLPDNSDNPKNLYDLIRSSEGPDHMEIKLEVLFEEERDNLRGLLSKVAENLKEAAGEISAETYVPPGFAVFPNEQRRDAEMLPRTPSRRPSSDDSKILPPPDLNLEPPSPKPKSPRKSVPRAGNQASVARSLRPRLDSSGQVCGVEVWIEEHNHDHLGIRVFIDPGSDQTCERLLPSNFLKINRGDDPYEVALDRTSRYVSLDFLEEALPDSVGLSVELVRRKK